MATDYTVYADTKDNIIAAYHSSTWSGTREGSGSGVSTTVGNPSASTLNKVGTGFANIIGDSASEYFTVQAILTFDLSAIPEGDISNVRLYCTTSTRGAGASGRTFEAREIADFSGSVTTAQFAAGSTLSSKTLLGSDTSSASSEVMEFTPGSGAKVLPRGRYNIVLCSADQRTNTSPGANDRSVTFYSANDATQANRPRLEFSWEVPPISGGGTMYFDDWGVEASGVLTLVGASTSAPDVFLTEATGEILIVAAATPTLNTFLLESVGAVNFAPIVATGNPALDEILVTSAGSLEIAGSLSGELEAFEISSAAGLILSAFATAPLDLFFSESDGELSISGAGASSLATFSQDAEAALFITAILESELGTFTASGTGVIIRTAVTPAARTVTITEASGIIGVTEVLSSATVTEVANIATVTE